MYKQDMKKFSVDNVFLKITTFLWIILILHTSLFLEIVTTKFGGGGPRARKTNTVPHIKNIYIYILIAIKLNVKIYYSNKPESLEP